jgi:hypothetical protein
MSEPAIHGYESALAALQQAEAEAKAVVARATQAWRAAGLSTDALARWKTLAPVNSRVIFANSVWLEVSLEPIDVTGRPLAAELVAVLDSWHAANFQLKDTLPVLG